MAEEVEYSIQCIYLSQCLQDGLLLLLLRSHPLSGLRLSAHNMATLRELELRLKFVRNIEKITKVSKCFLELNACIVVYCDVLVHENDCIYQACQGTACNAEWEAV